MRIAIENYFGNDIIILDFKNRMNSVDQIVIDDVTEIALNQGYDFADLDEDEQGEYIRLQEVNVDNSDDDAIKDLLKLVQDLTEKYI